MAKFIPLQDPPRWSPVSIFGKPRFRMRRGVWVCSIPGDIRPLGHGYTPREAYRDWCKQIVLMGPLAA